MLLACVVQVKKGGGGMAGIYMVNSPAPECDMGPCRLRDKMSSSIELRPISP